jgi:hypothetical protein
MMSAATVLALQLSLTGRAGAQDCVSEDDGIALLASVGRVTQTGGSDIAGWDFGARVALPATTQLTVRVSYAHQKLPGASLDMARAGAALRLPVPGRPCLTLDAFGALGGSLTASGHYRNLTIPLGLLFTRRFRSGDSAVLPFVAIQAVFSTTSAELLSFALEKYELGYGALAGVRLQRPRFLMELTIQGTSLGSAVGPQSLGRVRMDLALGVPVNAR